MGKDNKNGCISWNIHVLLVPTKAQTTGSLVNYNKVKLNRQNASSQPLCEEGGQMQQDRDRQWQEKKGLEQLYLKSVTKISLIRLALMFGVSFIAHLLELKRGLG